MNEIIALLIWAIDIYIWIIIASIVISWLVAFDVLNTKNDLVYKACAALNALTNPPILKIRKHVPPVANMDFSPIILVFGLMVVQAMLRSLIRY